MTGQKDLLTKKMSLFFCIISSGHSDSCYFDIDIFCKKWSFIVVHSPSRCGGIEVHTYVHYDNVGCRVFKGEVQNWKDFCLKINTPKGNY